MRTHPTPYSPSDPISQWAEDLRTEVIGALSPESVGAIVGMVVVGAVSTTLAVVATASAAQGGVTMTTTIAASAASNTALKVAAIGLCASLAAGGTAAVTGNLPDGAQTRAADVAAHIGIDLPRPQAAVGGSLDLGVGDIVTVDGAGRVGVNLEGDAMVITGIEADAGFEAAIVSQTVDAIVVEFRSATETATVLLTEVEGSLVSSVTFDAQAEAEAEAEANAEAEAEAEADGGLEIQIGG